MNVFEKLETDIQEARDYANSLESGQQETRPGNQQLSPDELSEVIASYRSRADHLEAIRDRLKAKYG